MRIVSEHAAAHITARSFSFVTGTDTVVTKHDVGVRPEAWLISG